MDGTNSCRHDLGHDGRRFRGVRERTRGVCGSVRAGCAGAVRAGRGRSTATAITTPPCGGNARSAGLRLQQLEHRAPPSKITIQTQSSHFRAGFGHVGSDSLSEQVLANRIQTPTSQFGTVFYHLPSESIIRAATSGPFRPKPPSQKFVSDRKCRLAGPRMTVPV